MHLLLAPALTSSLCAPLHQMLDQLAVQPSFWLASFICAPLAALLLDFSIDQFSRLLRPRAYQVGGGGLGLRLSRVRSGAAGCCGATWFLPLLQEL